MTNKVSSKKRRMPGQGPLMITKMKHVIYQTNQEELEQQMAEVARQAREALNRKPPLRKPTRVYDV